MKTPTGPRHLTLEVFSETNIQITFHQTQKIVTGTIRSKDELCRALKNDFGLIVVDDAPSDKPWTAEELQQCYEVIFINDSSSDNSLDIIKSLVSIDPYVKFIDFGYELSKINT